MSDAHFTYSFPGPGWVTLSLENQWLNWTLVVPTGLHWPSLQPSSQGQLSWKPGLGWCQGLSPSIWVGCCKAGCRQVSISWHCQELCCG